MTRSGGRPWSLVLALVLLCVGIAGPASTQVSPQPNEVVVVALDNFGREVLDPTLDSGDGKRYAGNTTDYLVGLGPDGKLSRETGVLSDWAMGPDATIYVLKVRRGIKWQDGADLTADDVAFTMTYMARKEAICLSCGTLKQNLSKVEAVDPYTVRVYLKTPDATFIDEMAPIEGDAKVVPKHFIDAHGADAYNQSGMGSGPWKLVERKIGDYALFEANAGYWRKGGIPGFKYLRLNLVPESQTVLDMLRTREIDLGAVGADQLRLVQAAGLRVLGPRDVSTHVVMFPLSYDPKAWAHRLEFREALSLAVDREAIIKRFYPPAIGDPYDNQTAAFFSPRTLGYDPHLGKYAYDPAAAKRLLQQVGYDGTAMKFWSFVLAGASELPQVADVIAQMWQAVGINVQVVPTDYGTYWSMVTPAKQTLNPAVINVAIMTPRVRPTVLGNMRVYAVSKADGGLAQFYWDPAGADTLVNQLSGIVDPLVRANRLLQVNQRMHDEYWAIPVALRNATFAVGPKVQSWKPFPAVLSELNFPSLAPAK